MLRTFNSLPPDRLVEIEQNRTATALPCPESLAWPSSPDQTNPFQLIQKGVHFAQQKPLNLSACVLNEYVLLESGQVRSGQPSFIVAGATRNLIQCSSLLCSALISSYRTSSGARRRISLSAIHLCSALHFSPDAADLLLLRLPSFLLFSSHIDARERPRVLPSPLLPSLRLASRLASLHCRHSARALHFS